MSKITESKNSTEKNKDTLSQAEIITRGNNRYLKTPKGTELPLLQLRGRDYLQVAHRLVWFREEHPNWQIITRPLDINIDKKYAIFRSRIVNNEGKTLATATKGESIAGFNDYIEKAETSATGRALALCGFGTQFAPELDEGDRPADTPVSPSKKQLPVVNSVAFIREGKDRPTTVIKRESDASTKETCTHCGSAHMTIGLTKPDNPRNPNRPYWKCLDCPPEKSFSHWVKDNDITSEIDEKIAARESKSTATGQLPLE